MVGSDSRDHTERFFDSAFQLQSLSVGDGGPRDVLPFRAHRAFEVKLLWNVSALVDLQTQQLVNSCSAHSKKLFALKPQFVRTT